MHIEELMEQFEDDLLEMGVRVRRSMALALEAFVTDDKERALQVIELDEFINSADENINNQAIEILSLMQPVARDLRLLVGGIKISSDFERIGDYSKNIGRFVIKTKEIDKRYYDDIQALGDLFLKNFDQVLEVMKTKNVKHAYQIAAADEEIDVAFKKLLHRFADNADNEHLFPIETTGMLRNIERAGDHAKNICEQIVYIVKGQHIDLG